MQSNKRTITFGILLIVAMLSVVVFASSVLWAAFSAKKTGSTLISFDEGVELNITGITNHAWNVTNNMYVNNDTTTFNNISATCTKGTATRTVYVRTFAMIWTDSTQVFDNALSMAGSPVVGETLAKNANIASTTNLTTLEQGLINQYKTTMESRMYKVSTTTFTDKSTAQNLVAPIAPYLATTYSDASKGVKLEGKHIYGIVVITAMIKDGTAPTVSDWTSANTYTATALLA